MIAKILFISDLHKRYRDSESIKGQIAVQQQIQEDIISFNKANGITHNIVLGDWYDRGFHGLCQAYGAMEMDRRLAASVNGNVYLCVGNHFYLERDENPEMYIIQPNNFIRPQMPIPVPDKPIFKVVPTLTLGTVQIDFFHYNMSNKEYAAYRQPETTYHIGVYHDHTIVPAWVKEQEGLVGSSSTQSYFARIFGNIDLGVCGHIHTKIGTVTMEMCDTGRKVPLIIPGALGITQNKDQYKHASVDLPVVTINDDNSVVLEMHTFATHVDQLQFSAKKDKRTLMDSTIAAADVGNLKRLSVTHSDAALTSLPAYLKSRGYSDECLKLIDSAATDSLNLGTAYQIISGGV